VEGSCEHGIEPSGSIKFWEVLEGLHNLRLLMKGSSPYVSKQVSMHVCRLMWIFDSISVCVHVEP
jgi:hypothetical protein